MIGIGEFRKIVIIRNKNLDIISLEIKEWERKIVL